MAATIEILLPDVLVEALGNNPENLSRQALEGLVAQAYRAGKLSHAQAGEILGLDRWQTDAFLKRSKAFRPGEAEEYGLDLAALRRIGK